MASENMIDWAARELAESGTSTIAVDVVTAFKFSVRDHESGDKVLRTELVMSDEMATLMLGPEAILPPGEKWGLMVYGAMDAVRRVLPETIANLESMQLTLEAAIGDNSEEG